MRDGERVAPRLVREDGAVGLHRVAGCRSGSRWRGRGEVNWPPIEPGSIQSDVPVKPVWPKLPMGKIMPRGWRTSLSSVSYRKRTVLVRFAITSILAGCAVTPFVVAVMGQAHQISWIGPIGRRTIEDVTVQQYFERSTPFALLSALAVAAAIVLWLCTSAQLGEANR